MKPVPIEARALETDKSIQDQGVCASEEEGVTWAEDIHSHTCKAKSLGCRDLCGPNRKLRVGVQFSTHGTSRISGLGGQRGPPEGSGWSSDISHKLPPSAWLPSCPRLSSQVQMNGGANEGDSNPAHSRLCLLASPHTRRQHPQHPHLS